MLIPAWSEAGWTTWLTSVAAEFGLGEGRLAEGFAVFPTG